MASVAKYAGINTKVRVLEGNFLGKTQLQTLLQCNNCKEALYFLKEYTEYGEALEGYNLEEIHRGQLEVILKRHFIRKFSKLIHYFTGEYRKLFHILFMKYEIEDLKVIIREKYIGKQSNELSTLITHNSPLNHINYMDLISAKDLPDVAEKLKQTMYYKHITELMKSVKEEGLFRLEMTLDFVYFSSLRKFLKKIGREDREIIQLFNGTYADLLNIQWIFRGKKYYKLQPEVLINYTIYDGYKLSSDIIKNMCYAKSLEDFIAILNSLPYGSLFQANEDREHLIQKEMLVFMKKLYDKYRINHEMNISVVYAYLELALIECRDIITIVENKRYNQQSNETLKYITATLL